MTSDRVPLQTELFWVLGPPEGRDYAKAGSVEVDVTTGFWWWKSTNETVNTGWQRFNTGGAAGGNRQVYAGHGDPNTAGLVPDNPALACYYYDLDKILPNFQWDTVSKNWF